MDPKKHSKLAVVALAGARDDAQARTPPWQAHAANPARHNIDHLGVPDLGERCTVFEIRETIGTALVIQVRC